MPHLPPDWAQHLQSGCSHRVGARDPAGRPEICRALASQAAADGPIEVLLKHGAAEAVLAAIVVTRRVAYLAAHPHTNRVLHAKGSDAEIVGPRPEHWALVTRSRAAFGAAIAPYGYTDDDLKRVWFDVRFEDLRCLRFTPIGAWDQTPGIGAGAAIDLLP